MKHLSAVCIVNSNAVAQAYEQALTPEKIKLVYQAVTVSDQGETASVPPSQEAVESARTQCIIVGASQEGKRQDEAIKAIGELVSRGVSVCLYIVGDGEPGYKEYLQRLVAQDGLGNHVTFHGYVDNPFPLVQRADVMLMCSRFEAFGRGTVEGMKAGKPVIGARSGGTIELIREGFNGLLYSPGDHLELAQKIQYLHEHPEEARRMGENGKKLAEEQFNEQKFGEQILAILQETVKQPIR